MPQIYNDIVAYTIFISMCFMHVLSIHPYQHQHQHQHQQRQRLTDGNSSAMAAHDNENARATWQPMSQNNWIILKTTAKNIAAAENMASNHRHSHSMVMATAAVQAATPPPPEQLKYQYWHKEQQAYPAPHPPTNYYTYHQNNSSNNNGYYQQTTATDVKLIEPYIVTISKMRAHRTDSTTTHQREQKRQQQAANDALISRRIALGNVMTQAFGSTMSHVGAIKLPKDVVSSNVVATPKIELRQDIKKMYNTKQNNSWGSSSSSSNIGNTMKTSITFDDDKDDDKVNGVDDNRVDVEHVIDEMKADGAHLNEIFQPLQSTLDKIISFCDMAKRFISDTDANANDGDVDNDDYDDDAAEDNDDLFNEKSTTASPLKSGDDNEVQGRLGLSMKASSSSSLSSSLTQAQNRAHTTTTTTARASTTALTSVGTGRKVKKLKKKLSKFILPLLLAYKLKFLTLIPVLIGGLTLLVGTTGLAGFFFALFTAVMSLKSTGSSKSIIVKKI